MSTLVNEF